MDDNIQLNRKHHKVFYGWWIVVACFFIAMYVNGTVNYGFTAFFEPIANEFGWSYAQVSFAASIRGMEVTLLAPLVGLLFDRFGPRKLILIGAVSIGLGLMFLSRIDSLGTFYGAFLLIAPGFSMCSGAIIMMAVGNWFREKVTTATGIVISGIALGGVLVPLVNQIIAIFDWRVAALIIGLGSWGIILPLSLVVRHKPEQYGYLPDGAVSRKPVSSESPTLSPNIEPDIGVRKALKSRIFWQFALGLMCHTLVINAVITHVMPYLSTTGIARSTSSLVASAIPITSILGRLSFGWFGDRFDKRWVTAIGFALTVFGLLIWAYVTSARTWLLVPFFIIFGFGYGGPIPMIAALLREYFGRLRFGTILGLTMGVAGLGSMAGPPLAGWVFDSFDNYQYAWFAFAFIITAGMVSFLTIPPVVNTIRTANNRKTEITQL